jgi:hypothetical protein
MQTEAKEALTTRDAKVVVSASRAPGSLCDRNHPAGPGFDGGGGTEALRSTDPTNDRTRRVGFFCLFLVYFVTFVY